MGGNAPPTDFVGWERALTRHFLMADQDGDGSPIRTFGISPDGLARAAEMPAGDESGAQALAAFRSTVCRGLLPHALDKGNFSKGIAPDEVPGCFAFLVVTLLVASQPNERTGLGGEYRDKLNAFVGGTPRQWRLHGVAKMWLFLKNWLEGRREKGLPYRSLILPHHPKGWTHIGYTLRLAFPTKPDATLLRNFLVADPDLAGDAWAFIRGFETALNKGHASEGMHETFGSFRRAFEAGDRVLADHPFWTFAQSCLPGSEATPQSETSAEMSFDEDGDAVFAVLDSEGLELVPGPLTLSAAASELSASKGGPSSLAYGVLFFRLSGYARWETVDGPDGGAGTLHLGCSAEAHKRLREHRQHFEAHGDWFLTRAPVGAAVADACASMLGLRNAGDRLSSVSVFGGIKTDGLWLGRPAFLPQVHAGPMELRVVGRPGATGVLAAKPAPGGGRCWALNADVPVGGPWLIEPAADERSWSRHVTFSPDAVPHRELAPGPQRHDALADWSGGPAEPIRPVAFSDVWEDGDPRIGDLIEAVYAQGRSGLSEQTLARLSRDALGGGHNPWAVMRVLRDATILQPRLRSGWKGRIWTLRPPCIRIGDGISSLEGAICERLARDFRAVALAEGARPFRRRGSGDLAPPLLGAVGGDMEAVAARLGWSVAPIEAVGRIGPRRAFAETPLKVLGRQVAREWDWERSRFVVPLQTGREGVKLRLWVQPGGNDHDVLTVDAPGQEQRRFVSRPAAIAMAHCFARVPMFGTSRGALVGLFPDAAIPDAIAARLRLRHMTNPGLQEGVAVYPADDRDLSLMATLMPGCVAPQDEDHVPALESVASARHSRGTMRLGWVNGRLAAVAVHKSRGDGVDRV